MSLDTWEAPWDPSLEKSSFMAVEESIKDEVPLFVFQPVEEQDARIFVSLYQMAKTLVAIKKLKESKIPYISIMIDPIYGGVSASLSMLGDINIAEPRALVGFTGPRVRRYT